MNSMKYALVLLALVLTACSDKGVENSDARRICSARNLQPGTAAFDNCVSEEAASAQIKQLHEEREQYKREQEYQRSYHY